MPGEHEILLARLDPSRHVFPVARFERAQHGQEASRVLRIRCVHDVDVESVRRHALEDCSDAVDEDEPYFALGECTQERPEVHRGPAS